MIDCRLNNYENIWFVLLVEAFDDQTSIQIAYPSNIPEYALHLVPIEKPILGHDFWLFFFTVLALAFFFVALVTIGSKGCSFLSRTSMSSSVHNLETIFKSLATTQIGSLFEPKGQIEFGTTTIGLQCRKLPQDSLSATWVRLLFY